jgi:hypothetical protein
MSRRIQGGHFDGWQDLAGALIITSNLLGSHK